MQRTGRGMAQLYRCVQCVKLWSGGNHHWRTIRWLQWPPDVTAAAVSDKNRGGKITNLDLEMAGLLLLWLMIEHVCSLLTKKRVALFGDNSPTVSWVQQMACRSSFIAGQLIRVLALRINAQRSCPLTMLHISGNQNLMTGLTTTNNFTLTINSNYYTVVMLYSSNKFLL